MYPNNRFPTNLQCLQGLRVLVVDHNGDFSDSIALLLQPYGVEVQTASLTQQALEIFVQWQPDVLVSDIALSKEGGYPLIQQVRTQAGERGEAVLIIAVTGYANKKILQSPLYVGFDLLFTKPLDFNEFLAVLACLAICQQSSYTIAQRILGHVPRHDRLSLEKQLDLVFPS
ncbi:response regulator [Desmonostoc muscorum LEGE 12446]|uniref:Response regulator n=1 Tax=Desmonostoc muscorum LEGE 12446 TaxID=1828758 RepID=A0A8J7DDM7_DESMC|nr:response regulator [Desmonostoc muscorum]MCF2150259.1 response regulator [Desmonostoc muscorum LEGE 12446]